MAHEADHRTLAYRPPLKRFLSHGFVGSGLLLLSSQAALIMANVGFYETYYEIWHSHFSLQLGPWEFDQTLHHWVNDGLMAIFFFVVGLEIKREILVGELSSRQKALLPAAGALGGMIAPALIYVAFNFGRDSATGWGIPMATDIAFAAGCLGLMRKRVPAALMVFLVALAIVDDLGAVLVIAIFYTERLAFGDLAVGLFFIGVSFAMCMWGVRRTWPYVVVGILTWVFFLASGVHATIAGVLLALTIPSKARHTSVPFRQEMDHLLDLYDDLDVGTREERRVTPPQQDVIRALNRECHNVEAPLQRIEYNLEPFVAFVILPLFAFANSGVVIEWANLGGLLFQPVTIGIFLGLLVGKQLGVFGASWLAVKTGLAAMPANVRWGQIYAVGLFAGIGFTMALFINELAFKSGLEPETAELYMSQGKVGTFLASITAGVLGLIVLSRFKQLPPQTAQHSEAPEAPVPVSSGNAAADVAKAKEPAAGKRQTKAKPKSKHPSKAKAKPRTKR